MRGQLLPLHSANTKMRPSIGLLGCYFVSAIDEYLCELADVDDALRFNKERERCLDFLFVLSRGELLYLLIAHTYASSLTISLTMQPLLTFQYHHICITISPCRVKMHLGKKIEEKLPLWLETLQRILCSSLVVPESTIKLFSINF